MASHPQDSRIRLSPSEREALRERISDERRLRVEPPKAERPVAFQGQRSYRWQPSHDENGECDPRRGPQTGIILWCPRGCIVECKAQDA